MYAWIFIYNYITKRGEVNINYLANLFIKYLPILKNINSFFTISPTLVIKFKQNKESTDTNMSTKSQKCYHFHSSSDLQLWCIFYKITFDSGFTTHWKVIIEQPNLGLILMSLHKVYIFMFCNFKSKSRIRSLSKSKLFAARNTSLNIFPANIATHLGYIR